MPKQPSSWAILQPLWAQPLPKQPPLHERQCRLRSRGQGTNKGCAMVCSFSCTAARNSVRSAAEAWRLAQTGRTGPKQLLRIEVWGWGWGGSRENPPWLTQSLREAYANLTPNFKLPFPSALVMSNVRTHCRADAHIGEAVTPQCPLEAVPLPLRPLSPASPCGPSLCIHGPPQHYNFKGSAAEA